jgi:hypothetical protein
MSTCVSADELLNNLWELPTLNWPDASVPFGVTGPFLTSRDNCPLFSKPANGIMQDGFSVSETGYIELIGCKFSQAAFAFFKVFVS